MVAPSNSAARRYALAASLITASAIALTLDLIYLRPRSPTLQQKAFGIFLALAAIYTQTVLRTRHVYHYNMVRNSCAPPRMYAGDALGISYLLESARALNNNSFLLLRASQLDKLGRTFQARIFPQISITIMTDEPENIKTVLSTKFNDWILPKRRVDAFRPVLGSHSIFTTNGPEWQHSRTMLRPAFVRDQISDLACFDTHISKLIDRIPKDGSRFDLQALFAMLTMDSISDFMFGQTTDILGTAPSRAVTFGSWFDASLVKIARRSRLGWITRVLPDRDLNKYVAFNNSYVDEIIAHRKQVKQARGQAEPAEKYVFLDELLKTGEPDEVIRNQLLSIFLAGRDTTTSVLTYLFLELSRRPDIVASIQQEILELDGETPTWEQLKNMKYLNWTVKESLRMNPPVPGNSREAIRDTILPVGGGPDNKSPIFVTKGSILSYQVWTMQRRKDLFGDDAEEFRPERWENLKIG